MSKSEEAASAVQNASNSRWFERVARFGYVGNAVLHGLIGGIAISMAFGGSGEADQGGALDTLSRQPLGGALLWVCFIGCIVLGIWSISQAVFERADKATRRIKDAGTGVVFLAIGATFGTYAMGGREDSGEKTSGISAELMSNPVGNFALLAAGAGLIGMAAYYVYKGVSQRFKRDLSVPGDPRQAKIITVTGVVGYVAKGLVLAALGLLFIVATLQHDPEDSTGIDGALRAVRDQPFGVPALAAIGIGLIAYGVYLLFRARYDKMD